MRIPTEFVEVEVNLPRSVSAVDEDEDAEVVEGLDEGLDGEEDGGGRADVVQDDHLHRTVPLHDLQDARL